MTYATYEWFLKNDFSQYSGKWLAIIGKEVVASGENVNMLIKQVKKHYPNKRPFITKVRSKLSIL
ncbi:MAG: succinyl-CoA synthetase subunit alpha [Nanoarchaeota archaeon]|nr:succinyl-CoA synthetase subunit alpha [Nanoarchaeota archaeon]